MNAKTLIESRHSVWMERLRELNRRANVGETDAGLVDIETAEAQAAAVVDELEHIASALGITLDERRGG